MPITAEEYQIGQLFMIAKHSHEQSDAGEGVEVILNVPHTDPVHGEGRYTEKQIHLSSRLPDWLQSFIPRLFCVTEKAWNYYPYTETEYTCSFLPKFNIFIKTKYENNSGTTENCLGLSPEELANRIVEHVDIVYDEVAPKHYKETEDPKFFKSKKTNRGPLINGWQETFESIMCIYKLVNVSFEVWGLQTKVEDYAHKAIRDILLLGHRQAFAWIDEWYGMTIEDVREYEVKMQEETNKKVLKRSEAVEISQDAGAGAIEVEEGNDEEGNPICKNLKEKAFKDAEKEKDNNEDMSKYEDDYHMPKPQSKTGSVGKSILVESNIFKIDIQHGEDHVFVYAVYFDLEEVLEYRKLSVESVRARIGNTYLYDGTFLYSLGKLPKCVMKFRIPHPMKPEIVLKFKVMYRSKSKLGKCQGLLKHLITTLPEFLGCKPHHRIFYSPGICKKVPNSDIEVYGAYRLRVAQAELSPTIIVDVIHCLQRGRTIANMFTTFNGQLEDKLLKLKNYCLGKFAADIAHNVVVKVGDVYMKDIAIPWLKVWTKSHPEKKLPNRCEECLTVSSSSYSLLVNRNGVTPSSSEKTNITKFTKVSPNVRVKCIQRFVEAVHGNIECTDFLRQWKIILNPKPVTVRARVIPSPCVSFGGEVQIQNSRLFWNPKEDAPTKMVLDPIELHTWSLFCLENVVPLAQKLLASLFFESKSLGVIIGRGSLEIVKMKHRRPLVSLLAEKMLRKINAGTRFVIVILPNTSGAFEAKEVYSQLKKICMEVLYPGWCVN
ncbi:unnamed protein product [Allacma fusca]|uniref:Phosphatidylinositol transfer protein N-terminal domain-containing protein n=1 Tax=Allacma fusca TaxID=39272 RepID=A0A8J2JF25_9HEXA|nr:unnamed protein product [Allacma fusca]